MEDAVVILDRDGTINVDRHYLAQPEQLEFAPGAVEGLRKLEALRCRLIIVTNQSGVGRGMFDLAQLERIHHRLLDMIAGLGVRIAGLYFCPHAPDVGCACRKPGTALMSRAAAEHGFDPASAIVIGDKAADVDFGKRCGATTILIAAGKTPAVRPRPDFTAASLREAAEAVERLLESRRRSAASV